MQVCRSASLQVCRSAGLQVCKSASLQVCKSASLQSASLQSACVAHRSAVGILEGNAQGRKIVETMNSWRNRVFY